MTKTKTILISAVVAIALAVGLFLASGGSDPATLHFTWGDMTEAAYAAKVQGGFNHLAASGYSVAGTCATYASLSPDALDRTVSSADPATRQRAIEILFDVCKAS